MSQLACKANRGLFRGAAVMSAMIFDPYLRREVGRPERLTEAEKKGEDFFAFLGAGTLEEARALDAVTLQRSYEKYMESHIPFFTVQDDLFCTGDPIALYTRGECVDAVMMAGSTSDEFLNTVDAKDEAGLKKEAERIFGGKAAEFLAFPESRREIPGQGYAPVSGIGCSVRTVLGEAAKAGRKGYCYCFDPDIPGWDHPGTFHSSDLWFWFETLAKCWRPFTGRHYDLARQMCDYFCNFIRSGDPNGKDLNGEELPKWEGMTAERPFAMEFTGEGPKPLKSAPSDFSRFITERIMDRIRST